MQNAADLSPPDTASPAGGVVTRLASANARQALSKLQSSPAIGEGRICLVSLDAVRERMGARWVGRREVVYENMQATLRRHLQPHDLSMRISETEFLVAQPGASRLAGQACCLNVLREVLTYFLGSVTTSEIVVCEVSSIDGEHIGARKLDPFALEAQVATLPPEPAEPPPRAPPFVSQDRWSPFVSHDGRRLRVSCQLEPVFQLKTYARIGYRMTRRALQLPAETPLSAAEEAKLAGADIERLDFATLARGLNRLQQQAEGERQPSLILPVSYATLSSHRGRAQLAEFLRAARSNVQQGLICEICDIEGIPPSALLAATSLIKPFCLFVLGRLQAPPPGPLTALRDVGLHGLCVPCPSGLTDEEAFCAFVETVMKAARPAGVRAVMMTGIASARLTAIAGLCGATHASFTPAPQRTHYVDARRGAGA